MANEFLNIPNTIIAGFRTYEGAEDEILAMMTYYKKGGKRIAKKKSWNSFKSDRFPVKEFQNIPLSGFKIDRSVWCYGESKCRIWDPRGFYVKIYTSDLLKLVKDSGYDENKGEFKGPIIYAWDYTRPILVSINSEDYKATMEMRSKRENLKIDNLVPGRVYRTLYHDECMYLGNLVWKLRRRGENYAYTKYYPSFLDVSGRNNVVFGETTDRVLYQIKNTVIKDKEEKIFNTIEWFKKSWAGNLDELVELGIKDVCNKADKDQFKRVAINRQYLPSAGYNSFNCVHGAILSSDKQEINVFHITVGISGFLTINPELIKIDRTAGCITRLFPRSGIVATEDLMSQMTPLPIDDYSSPIIVKVGSEWYDKATDYLWSWPCISIK